MKSFYTKAELKKLSVSELKEFSSFGNEKNTWFYSEINRITGSSQNWNIILKNGEEVFTDEDNVLEDVQLGKIRWDMTMKSIEEVDGISVNNSIFIKEFKDELSSQIKSFKKNLTTEVESIKSVTNSQDIRVNQILSSLEIKLDGLIKNYNKKIDKVNFFNEKAYEVKMEKIDKIIDSFSTLLEEE